MKIMSKRTAIDLMSTYRAVVILLLMVAVASLLAPNFLTVTNLFNVIRQVSIVAIIGCGMTFVILTGGIDLSVGAVVGLAGAVCAGVMIATESVFLGVLAALGVGIFCGILSGFFVAKCGIPPFIATLGLMTLFRGLVMIYTGGAPISARVDSFNVIGRGSFLGVPIPIIILALIYIIAYFILQQTQYGRNVYALGGNKEATRLSGISTVKTEWVVYIISGFLSAIAAVVLTARLGSAQALGGSGYELDAIAAVILGGTSLNGGSGFVLPTVAGALIIGIIDNTLTLLNVNPHMTVVVKGAVILLAVLVDKKVKEISQRTAE